MRAFIVLVLLTAGCSSPGTTGTGGGTGGTGGSGGSGGGSSTGGGSGGGGGVDAELTCDASPPAVSFTKVYADVFTPSCTGACHKTGAADGSENYGVYTTEAQAYTAVGKESLYAGPPKELKIVDPNVPGNSALYLKVIARSKSPAGRNLAGAMPLGAAPLSATHKQLLKDWICGGAKP